MVPLYNKTYNSNDDCALYRQSSYDGLNSPFFQIICCYNCVTCCLIQTTNQETGITDCEQCDDLVNIFTMSISGCPFFIFPQCDLCLQWKQLNAQLLMFKNPIISAYFSCLFNVKIPWYIALFFFLVAVFAPTHLPKDWDK